MSIQIRVATVLLTVASLGPAASPTAQAGPQAPTGYSTTGIGSTQWWSRVPARYPDRVRHNGQWVLTCPNGWTGGPAGMLLPARNGKVTVAWRGGGTRTVPAMTYICQKAVGPLRPKTPEELAGWTFASGRNLLREVRVAQPPLTTCVPAAAPTGWSATVNNVDLITGGRPIQTGNPNAESTTFTFSGANLSTGFYSITWTLTGGSGLYRYNTLNGTTYGKNKWVPRDVTFEPAGTSLTIRSFLTTLPLLPLMAMQMNAIGGDISPLCGEEHVPWGFDPLTSYGNNSGRIKYTLAPTVINRDGTFTVESTGTDHRSVAHLGRVKSSQVSHSASF